MKRLYWNIEKWIRSSAAYKWVIINTPEIRWRCIFGICQKTKYVRARKINVPDSENPGSQIKLIEMVMLCPFCEETARYYSRTG